MEWNGSPRLSTQSNKMQAAEQFKRKTKNVWFRNQKIIADLIEFGATKFVIIRKGMLAFIAQTYIKGLRWWVDEPISDNKINDLEIKKHTERLLTWAYCTPAVQQCCTHFVTCIYSSWKTGSCVVECCMALSSEQPMKKSLPV